MSQLNLLFKNIIKTSILFLFVHKLKICNTCSKTVFLLIINMTDEDKKKTNFVNFASFGGCAQRNTVKHTFNEIPGTGDYTSLKV